MTLSFTLNPSTEALVDPKRLPPSFSISNSGLYHSQDSTWQTRFPTQLDSPYWNRSPTATNPVEILSSNAKLQLLQNILKKLQYNDEDPTGSPLVPATTKYELAPSLPIAGFLAIVHLDANDASKTPSTTPKLDGPYLVVLGPTAFSAFGKPSTPQDFTALPTTLNNGHFSFPSSNIAPAFGLISGQVPPTISSFQPVHWFDDAQSSIMTTFRSHQALFSTVIAHSHTDFDHTLHSEWSPFWIPVSPRPSAQSDTPVASSVAPYDPVASSEDNVHNPLLHSKLNEAQEGVLSVGPFPSDDDPTPSTVGSWVLLSVHPLPPNHAVPIGLFLNATKLDTPVDFINTILGWFQSQVLPNTPNTSARSQPTADERLQALAEALSTIPIHPCGFR